MNTPSTLRVTIPAAAAAEPPPSPAPLVEVDVYAAIRWLPLRMVLGMAAAPNVSIDTLGRRSQDGR
jgi:hypothetical protein